MPDNHAILDDMNNTPRVLDASDPRILAEQNRPLPKSKAKPASEKQVNLIVNLCGERGLDVAELIAARFGDDVTLDTLTGGRQGTASDLITHLFSIKRPATEGTTPAKSAPEPGFYRVDDSVVRIQVSKAGNWYARLAKVPAEDSGKRSLDWDYLGKRIDMRNAVAMTEAEAGRFLVHCVRCGAELTNDDSKAAGMGPVCRTR
jgi:hypothetical protein